jgi:long-subunit fatty acid transport protein
MTRIGIGLIAIGLVISRVPALAQTSPVPTVPAVSVVLPNYNTVPIGEVASLEGGAFVARADDASAGFYNSAGLARAERTSVSGSAGAFQFSSVSPEGLNNVEGSFQQIPSMFGLVLHNLLGHPTLAGGLSIVRVNAWAQAVEAESVRPGVAGANRFRFSTDATFDAWQTSLGIAYDRSDRFRLGASLDGQYTWTSRRQSIADQLTTPTGLDALNVNAIGNLSVSHLRATLATQFELTPSFHLGLVMRTPGIGVTATGSASLEGLARTGGNTATTTFFDPDAGVEYRLPFEFRGGLAWLGKRAQLEADVFSYSGNGQYQLVTTTNTVTTISDNGQGGTPIIVEQPYVSPTVDARAVINVAVGGQYHLTESGAWALHGGYATDRSPVGANDTAFTKVNLQKVTMGMSARTSMFLGSLGLQYLNGQSAPLTLGITPDGSAISTRFKVSSFGVVYSLAVLF